MSVVNSQPLVSIIIPTYNRAQLIGETLDSVLAQTYENWECIIVDDGSTDSTAALIDEYINKDSRFKYYLRPLDKLPGGNEARNYGFEKSEGEFVNWFDDDDIMLSDFLKLKVEAITPEIDLVICTGSFWNPVDDSLIKKELKLQTNLYTDFLCWRLKILTPSVLFRKAFFYDKELFSSRILRGQESELFLRIFYQIPKDSFNIINKSLFLYRQHPNNKTTKDAVYKPEFIGGRYFIYYSNFLRLLGTDEKEGINFCYHQILNLFYLSVNHGDKILSNKIRKEFFPHAKQLNKIKAIEMCFFSKLFLLINRSSYKVIARWKIFKF